MHSVVYPSHYYTKGEQMAVGSQLQDKIHEKGKYGRCGRTYMVSLCVSRSQQSYGTRSVCQHCTVGINVTRWMGRRCGPSHCGHATPTHASCGFVLLITIHEIVEKGKSFNTQRMLAHGIQATQATAIQTTEGCVRG